MILSTPNENSFCEAHGADARPVVLRSGTGLLAVAAIAAWFLSRAGAKRPVS
jgi:hypothetical protein